MPLAEALALQSHGQQTILQSASKCAAASTSTLSSVSPHIAAYQPSADAQQLRQLARMCHQFSPLVGIEDHDTGSTKQNGQLPCPSCLYLDATYLGDHFGGEQQMAEQIVHFFQQHGYQVHLAIADTLGAAWAAAHYAHQQATFVPARHIPGSAPLCSAMSDGTWSSNSSYLVIDTAHTVSVLHALPVASLRISSRSVQLLEQLGIFTVQQLLRLPRNSLPSRFGEEVLHRCDQARGRSDELLTPYHPAAPFQAEETLEHPTDCLNLISGLMHRVIERVATALQAKHQGACEWICNFRCHPAELPDSRESTDAQPHTLRLRLSQSTDSVRHILELLKMQLDRHQLPGPIDRVRLRAQFTEPLSQHQEQLFVDTVISSAEQLPQLIDRLATRLGSQAVVRPQLVADFQPEHAFFYQELTANSDSANPSHSSNLPAQHPPQLARPLFLMSTPQPLDVVALAHTGPPAQIFLHQRPFRIIRHWGPERLETGWWRRRTIRRDYYRLETGCGRHFWVFRQLDSNRWYLHGLFA
jgi:protein ImuB